MNWSGTAGPTRRTSAGLISPRNGCPWTRHAPTVQNRRSSQRLGFWSIGVRDWSNVSGPVTIPSGPSRSATLDQRGPLVQRAWTKLPGPNGGLVQRLGPRGWTKHGWSRSLVQPAAGPAVRRRGPRARGPNRKSRGPARSGSLGHGPDQDQPRGRQLGLATPHVGKQSGPPPRPSAGGRRAVRWCWSTRSTVPAREPRPRCGTGRAPRRRPAGGRRRAV